DVYLWVGANADAFTWCGLQTPGCPYGDANFGRNGILPVAFTQLDIKRTYVHFDLPTLPAGTEVQEAYLELYHGGRNEDGRSDDVDIPVALVPTAWDPMTITHNNQPIVGTPGSFTALNLRSQSWSGTPDIAGQVAAMFADPSSNHGFALTWPSPAQPIEKGFTGINDIRRTRTDLGQSPRLLVRVRLPEGRTASDIVLPPLLSTNDLNPAGSGPILMVRTTSGGSDWPTSWNVTRGL
ncbi:MAG TPA: DNRLRE domain-containing protein, partial [Rhodothermales bacterium]|nr:DNRLRE domain-containing protein [Rhodothermales bacterium]